jgi:hypothetical protein
MRKFFAANIERSGRIVRGILGASLLIAGLAFAGSGRWLGFGFVAAEVFVLFEAARGWCIIRACGIKTKL